VWVLAHYVASIKAISFHNESALFCCIKLHYHTTNMHLHDMTHYVLLKVYFQLTLSLDVKEIDKQSINQSINQLVLMLHCCELTIAKGSFYGSRVIQGIHTAIWSEPMWELDKHIVKLRYWNTYGSKLVLHCCHCWLSNNPAD